MDAEYMRKIQKWVECDNKILEYKEQVKDVHEKKKELEEDILSYVESKKFDKLTINITDGNIKFGKRNITQPVNMKLIRSMLEQWNGDQRGVSIPVTELCQFIQDNLEVRTKVVMNRDIRGTDAESSV